MTAQLSPLGVQKFYDNNGNPLSFGLLYTYAAGTTNPQATYVDSTQTTQNTNPIQLNFRGECTLWLDPTLTYKLLLTDSAGNTIPNWPVDNVPGGPFITPSGTINIPVSLIPNPTNTLTLGNSTHSWANVYVGVNDVPVIDPVSGNIGYYARTAAEIAATVTPTIYIPTLQIDLERYGGGVGASAAANNAALTSALAVITQKGGGVLVSRGSGTYTFSNSFSFPVGLVLQGDGYDTIWNYTGSGSFLTISSTGGRSTIRELQLIGTSQTGTGLSLGDTSGEASFIDLYRVLISKWNTALRIGGATWLTARGCEFGNASGNSIGSITNNVGIDFNAFINSSANYCSQLKFRDCTISNNANAGVQATLVPVTMNVVKWDGCTIQNNCQSATSNPQFYMGPVEGFSMRDIYMEYVLGGTAPDAIRSDNMAAGAITDFYINTAANGIKDRGGGSMGQVDIEDGQFISMVTSAINCASEFDVIARNLAVGAAAVTLTGSGCKYLATGSALASWPTDEVSFSPAIAFGTSGSITQTVQAATYSRVGNIVTFNLRINWSAISSPSGSVTITGFPIAPKTGGPDAGVVVGYAAGLTIAAGYLGVFIPNGSTTGTLYNVQTTTAAVQGSAFATSGSIIVSGSYQV